MFKPKTLEESAWLICQVSSNFVEICNSKKCMISRPNFLGITIVTIFTGSEFDKG